MMAPDEITAVGERRPHWEIHVDTEGDGQTFAIYLRLDRGLMTEGAAKFMAAHFAKALHLSDLAIVVHVR